MSLTKKILLIIILVGGAAFAINSFYRLNSTQTGSTKKLTRDTMVRAVGTLEFKKQLTDDEKKKFTDNFNEAMDSFNKNLEDVKKEGPSVEALLYWPLIALGNIHRDVGAYDKADVAYRYAHQIQPQAFIPLGNLGDLYFRYVNDYPKAEQYFLQVIEIPNPNIATYYSELYELYRFHFKDQQKAEDILVQGVKKYPEETDILALLAFYYRDTGQIEKAISRYHELLVKVPDSSVAKRALGELQKK